MAKDFYEISNNSVSLFVVSSDSTVTGDIDTKQDIRIDGIVNGKIYCAGKVVIGENAKVNGEIEANDIDLYGELTAKAISHNNFVLKSTAKFSGECKMKNLISEIGAQINLQANMETTDNIKSLKDEKKAEVADEDESLY